MTTVTISEHKEYQLLKVEVDGREHFYGHRSDFLSFDLIGILKSIDSSIEIKQVALTGP